MRKLLMTVYSDIKNDARVIRSAEALATEFDVYLYTVGTVDIPKVTCISVEGIDTVGGISAYIKYIRGVLQTTQKLRPDIIYGHDIFSAFPLRILYTVYSNCKYIYDAHELFTVEKGKKYSAVDRILYWSEGSMIRRADLTVCAEEQRAKYMVKYHNLQKEPLVIRNISYLSEGNADEFLRVNSDFFAKEAIGIVYAGGLLYGRKLEKLVDAVEQLGERYKLMLVGNGPAKESLEKQISQCRNANIRLCGAVPYRSLGAVLAKFDLGYLYYGTDSLNNLYCAPNKIYEYASVGLPILANENPTVESIVSSCGLGVCDNDIAHGLEVLSESYDLCREHMKTFIEANTLENEMKCLCSAVGML